jgi:hypothetical protein
VSRAGGRVGVLAEDETDCDALRELINRILDDVGAPRVGVDRDWGNGCAGLRRKARAMLRQMASKGCGAVVLVHDLDRDPANGQLRDERALRAALEAIECPTGVRRLICIPVEELEAWFWSDQELLDEVAGIKGKAKAAHQPELVKQPKEQLIRLSRDAGKKPRYSTNENANLAKKLNLDVCAQRCRSFREFYNFVHSVVAPGGA